ncbi:MAG TPA: response regulator [Chloroflexi bacterium]|nr:response regulator [Chloroflexota bacterium]
MSEEQKVYSVLLVDDDPALRGLLRQMLELGGFTVYEAEDGLDALEKIPQVRPDAMILDVMMPNMDGVTLCRTVRSRPETTALPIIMLSGKTQDKAIQEGLAAGANVYLCKPISFNELISHVNDVLPAMAVAD